MNLLKFFIVFVLFLLNAAGLKAQVIAFDTTVAPATADDSLLLSSFVSDTLNQDIPGPGRLFEIPETGYTTEESRRYYRSDYYPLSLMQRGRILGSSYRGLLPGAATFNYAGNELRNPVIGFWNEQWLPSYQIGQRKIQPGSLVEYYEAPLPDPKAAISRIIFSQDYAVNYDQLDLNFSRKISKDAFIQLSGLNFTSNGSQSLSGYSRIALNAYRAQLHFKPGKQWVADAFYWQNRQRFTMQPLSGFTADRFKQVGHTAWIRLQGNINDSDSLAVVPAYTTIEDRYTVADRVVKNSRYHLLQSDIGYFRKSGRWRIGIQQNIEVYSGNGSGYWPGRASEGSASLGLVLKRRSSGYEFEMGGGAKTLRWEYRPVANISLNKKVADGRSLGGTAFLSAQTTPLLWRTARFDSLSSYSGKEMIDHYGASVFFRTNLPLGGWIQIEPFYNMSNNLPRLADNQTRWFGAKAENYGLRVESALNLWRFELNNDFTYNGGYQEAFAPQVDNITTVKTSIFLFKSNFQVDGLFTWHYIGNSRLVDFNRYLFHFQPSPTPIGQYYIADARIQAHFRQAIIFFVWENFLSEDYQIVSGTVEDFLIFRLGVDWVLFN